MTYLQTVIFGNWRRYCVSDQTEVVFSTQLYNLIAHLKALRRPSTEP